jgi:hypothetical protein
VRFRAGRSVEVAVACDSGLVVPSRWHWRAISGPSCGRGGSGVRFLGHFRPKIATSRVGGARDCHLVARSGAWSGRGGSGVRFRTGRSVEVALACDFGPVVRSRWQWRAVFGRFSSQNCHLAGRGCTGLPPRGEIRGVGGPRWQWRAVSGWSFRRGGGGLRFRAGRSVEVALACDFGPVVRSRWQWRAVFGRFSSQNCHFAGRGCTGLPSRAGKP